MINPKVYDKLDEETKHKYVLAVSMRAINRVYDTLANYLYSIHMHDDADESIKFALRGQSEEFVAGWNEACANVARAIADLKYDLDDIDKFLPKYKEMIDEEHGGDVSLS